VDVASLKQALKRYGGFDDGDPLLDWINAAYHDFEDASDWPFLEAESIALTVTSNYEMSRIALPADLLKPIIVRNRGTGSVLEFLPHTAYLEEGYYDTESSTSSGEPQYYTLMNSQLFLFPTPDQVYDLWMIYQKQLPDLAADLDVPAIPTRYHYGLVYGAAAHGLQAESEEERAQSAQSQFELYISNAISKLGSRQLGQADFVRETAGYTD
jgi:hypothetical protein